MMNNNNNNRRRRNRRVNNSDSGRNSIVGPPSILVVTPQSFTVRYKTNATISSSVLFSDLFATYGIAVSTTSVVSLWESVRLRKIEMWGPSGSTIGVNPETTNNSQYGCRTISRIDSSVSDAFNSHIVYRPQKNSVQDNWVQRDSASVSGNYTLVGLTAPINTIIDITFNCLLSNDLTLARVVAGATVGTIYSKTLGGSMVPQGYNNL